MSTAPSRDLIVLSGAAALAVALASAAALLAPPEAPPGTGSTFSAGPHGAKAAYLLLARLGYRVERSFEPMAHLAADAPSTVVIIASPEPVASEADRRAAARFVERGGTLLATGLAGALLPRFTGMTGTPAVDPFAPREVETHQATAHEGLAEGAPSLLMTREASVSLVAAPYEVLYGTPARPAVLVASIGAGRAIWWAGSDPLLNGTISSPGHAELLLNVVGPPGGRRVIWSEYYHGHARSLWSYLADTPVVATLGQGMLLAVVALLTFGRRRGPVRPLSVEPRTSVLEFVDALAGLYRKAGAAAGAVEIGLTRTRRVLSGLARLPAGASDARLAAAASGSLGIPAEAVTETLRAADAAVARQDLSPAAALPIVQRLQALAAQAQESAAARSRPGA